MTSVLIASPGTSALLGPGVVVFPAVVLVLVVLAFVCLYARGPVVRVLTIVLGLWAAMSGASELASPLVDDLAGYYVAWIVAGVLAIAAAVWAFVRERRYGE